MANWLAEWLQLETCVNMRELLRKITGVIPIWGPGCKAKTASCGATGVGIAKTLWILCLGHLGFLPRIKLLILLLPLLNIFKPFSCLASGRLQLISSERSPFRAQLREPVPANRGVGRPAWAQVASGWPGGSVSEGHDSSCCDQMSTIGRFW